MFSDELKKARNSVGISQKALAKELELPFRTYQSWELGDRTPPKYVQKLLLEKLNSLEVKAD